MRIEVVIPTFNRHEMLSRTLHSLFAARRPAGLEVSITVVDNNSTDQTGAAVESWQSRFPGQIKYLFETRQGRSSALNRGIEDATADLIGMIDDDEEIGEQWFEEIEKAFSTQEVDFIGGPCLPNWGAPAPEWLPLRYRGVIGWVENGDELKKFESSADGILMGGNAVIRRSLIDRVGGYTTTLGRTDKRLLSCEDEDMYRRLLAAGGRGYWIPGLVIYHYVPPVRLTRSYHRSWCFWRGVSQGWMDRKTRAPVVYLLGVPRYLFGNAARGVGRLLTRRGDDLFSDELCLWDLAGFFYGRHLFKRGEKASQVPVLNGADAAKVSAS